jgi:hypothetical protein
VTPGALRSLIAGAETLDVEFKGEETHALSGGDLVSLSSASRKAPMPRGARG